ncbi:MAG: MFS transporter [Levilactobacillus sp.]|jgi:EmrB/QacA subfamily drug resistance transporter|uniref:MFS transporter n=1 Tax=Levilactobacillus sp. TaxID=2767919 RepID=UPI002584AC8B|nr:MFS transporter [Levilactobacillus sp.]MCI1553395.1 MFS transporter [Levilactobacillus sp.]MCI1599070.1 MFS transporter [Levilactobacillus sp.]MCI1606594.1 MFS transporter [Levilactobacillus sp.]
MTKEKIDPRVVGAVLATGLMSLSGVIVETAMNITFPTLMDQFQVTTGTVQWMTTLYLLIVACIVPVSSYLKRRFKLKQLFVVANLLFITGLVIDACATSFSWLLAGRAIQGVGTGIALPLMFNIILEQVPLSRIGMMTGVGTLITAIGPAIGPTYGGVLVTHLNWRYIFWILLPFLIVSFFVGIKTIRQVSPTQAEHFDFWSMLGVIVTFAGLIFGFSSLSDQPFLSWSVGGAMALGLVGLIFFVRRSQHQAQPLIHLQALANPAFAWHLLAFFLLQITALGLSFVLPNYLQLVDHQSAFIAGLVVLPGAVIGAAFSPIGGHILDRFGAKRPILLGLGLVVVMLLIMTVGAKDLSAWAILGLYVGYMIGVGSSFGNIMTDGLKQLSATLKADGNALMNAMQQFAGAMGTAIVSAMIAASQAGNAGSTAVKTATGSQWALWVLTIAGLGALLSMLIALKRNQH